MAAPNSSPDLSVVSEPEPARQDPQPSPESEAAAPAEETPPGRGDATGQRGVPWWVLAAVTMSGLVLFFGQYQRAEKLDVRVQALRQELEEAGQQLSAYQTHLDTVRLSVGELTDRVGRLKVLVEIDPLALPADENAELPAVSAPPPQASASAPIAPPSAQAESMTPAMMGEDATALPVPAQEQLGPVAPQMLLDPVLAAPLASYAAPRSDRTPPLLF